MKGERYSSEMEVWVRHQL